MVYDPLCEFRISKTSCTPTLKTSVTKCRCCNTVRIKRNETNPPEALQLLGLTFHKALPFLFGEAKKAWSKTLITPCAPGEFDFSASTTEGSPELGEG